MARDEVNLLHDLRELPSPKWRAWFRDTWDDRIAIHDTLEQCGVEVTGLTMRGDRMTGVETGDGPISAGTVVLAAGAWSGEIAKSIGLNLHISPDGYQAMTTFPVEPHLTQVLGSRRGLISLKQLAHGR